MEGRRDSAMAFLGKRRAGPTRPRRSQDTVAARHTGWAAAGARSFTFAGSLSFKQKMQKFYPVACFSLALGAGQFTAAAQADFRSGYVVRPAGDTLRGEVDYRDAGFNGQQCRFRATPEAATTTFGPAELLAYGLRDGSHLYRTQALPNSPALSTMAPQYFMEVLVSGPANLYTWRDGEQADHYYVATAAFPLAELVHRKVLLEEQRILQEQNTYRNTLAQALVGCPSAQAKLPALPFTPRALAQAVIAYNACRGVVAAQPAVAPIQRQRQPVRFGLVVGGERAKSHFEGSPSQFSAGQTNLVLGPSGAVVGGLTANVPLTALSTKLSLEAELLYESQAYGSGISGHYNYHFEMAYAKLPLLVRYTFPMGKVRPVVEGGPTIGYALKLKTETYFTNSSGVDGAAAGFFTGNQRRLQESLLAGVGVQFSYWQGRRATLLARYERDTGWGDGVYFATYATHLYGLLTLDLAK
ncbi:MAG: PorT family protein [Cytophagaceae bacterium]|nr:MAG: PorT family protein [Cytophagaceae bacterium]